jgi:hypothetical protein
MSFLSIFDKPSELARLIDECTSEMQLNTDIALNMQVCDQINREGTAAAKDAIKTIRKKLKSSSSNPKTCLLTLTLLEMMMKNCRAELHLEASNASFLKDLEELATSPKTDVRVRDKILELIQSWADAFNAFKDDLPMFDALYMRMKRQGISFPDRDLSGLVPVLTPDGSRATRMLQPQMEDTDAFGRSVDSSSVQPQLLTSSRVPAAQPARAVDHRGNLQHSRQTSAPSYVSAPTMVALPPSQSQHNYSQRGAPYMPPAPAVPQPYQYQYQHHPPQQGYQPQSHAYNPQQLSHAPHFYASSPAQVQPGTGWLQAVHGRQPAAATDETRSATLASLKEFIASCAAASELYAALLAAGDSSDLIQDLRAQCSGLQDRLSKTIPELQNEELLLQALSINDDMLAVLSGKPTSAGAAPAAVQREGNLLDIESTTSAASARASMPNGGDSFMDDLFGSSSAAPSQVPQLPPLPPGWEILFDQSGQRYYGHPGMKITQYEHPSQGIVQRAPQSFQQPAAFLPPPPFHPSQHQPIQAVQQPAYMPPQRFTQVPVQSSLAPPPFHAAPATAPAAQVVQPSSPVLEPQVASIVAAPVVSMDTIPGKTQRATLIMFFMALSMRLHAHELSQREFKIRANPYFMSCRRSATFIFWRCRLHQAASKSGQSTR